MIILDQRLIEQEEEKEEKGIDKLRISGRLNTVFVSFGGSQPPSFLVFCQLN